MRQIAQDDATKCRGLSDNAVQLLHVLAALSETAVATKKRGAASRPFGALANEGEQLIASVLPYIFDRRRPQVASPGQGPVASA